MNRKQLNIARRPQSVRNRRGCSPSHVAVARVLHDATVTGAMVGARRFGKVRGLVGADEFRLNRRELAEIEASGRLHGLGQRDRIRKQ